MFRVDEGAFLREILPQNDTQPTEWHKVLLGVKMVQINDLIKS